MLNPKLNDFLCNLQTLFLQNGKIPHVKINRKHLKLKKCLKTEKMREKSC